MISSLVAHTTYAEMKAEGEQPESASLSCHYHGPPIS